MRFPRVLRWVCLPALVVTLASGCVTVRLSPTRAALRGAQIEVQGTRADQIRLFEIADAVAREEGLEAFEGAHSWMMDSDTWVCSPGAKHFMTDRCYSNVEGSRLTLRDPLRNSVVLLMDSDEALSDANLEADQARGRIRIGAQVGSSVQALDRGRALLRKLQSRIEASFKPESVLRTSDEPVQEGAEQRGPQS